MAVPSSPAGTARAPRAECAQGEWPDHRRVGRWPWLPAARMSGAPDWTRPFHFRHSHRGDSCLRWVEGQLTGGHVRTTISDVDVERYQRDGFLVIDDFLSRDEV